eukprot:g8641.t1
MLLSLEMQGCVKLCRIKRLNSPGKFSLRSVTAQVWVLTQWLRWHWPEESGKGLAGDDSQCLPLLLQLVQLFLVALRGVAQRPLDRQTRSLPPALAQVLVRCRRSSPLCRSLGRPRRRQRPAQSCICTGLVWTLWAPSKDLVKVTEKWGRPHFAK